MNSLSNKAECVLKIMYSLYFQQLKSISPNADKEDANFIDGLFWTKDKLLSEKGEAFVQDALKELKGKGYIRDYGDIIGSYSIVEPVDPR